MSREGLARQHLVALVKARDELSQPGALTRIAIKVGVNHLANIIDVDH